ncbi:MAG: NAD-dependent epimerase/dehydratase family protein [Bacteroidota bacterium]
MVSIDTYYANRRVLITGGLGFIGSSIARALVRAHANVTLFDALLVGYGGNRFNIDGIDNSLTIIIGDQRDQELIKKAVAGQDIVFNLAGTLSHIDSISDPFTDLDINCRAQLSLLEACRKCNPTARILFAGTRGEYGRPAALPVKEDDPLHPIDINGIHNVAAEWYHSLYYTLHGLRTTTLRLTNTYGPRHQMRHSRQGIINWFVREALDNETIKLFGGGAQIRDATYIDDIVSVFLAVAAQPETIGGVYNVGGNASSLKNIAETVIRLAGSGSVCAISFPEEYKRVEIGDYIADGSLLSAVTGWKPSVDLEIGLEKTIAFYRQYKNHYW